MTTAPVDPAQARRAGGRVGEAIGAAEVWVVRRRGDQPRGRAVAGLGREPRRRDRASPASRCPTAASRGSSAATATCWATRAAAFWIGRRGPARRCSGLARAVAEPTALGDLAARRFGASTRSPCGSTTTPRTGRRDRRGSRPTCSRPPRRRRRRGAIVDEAAARAPRRHRRGGRSPGRPRDRPNPCRSASGGRLLTEPTPLRDGARRAARPAGPGARGPDRRRHRRSTARCCLGRAADAGPVRALVHDLATGGCPRDRHDRHDRRPPLPRRGRPPRRAPRRRRVAEPLGRRGARRRLARRRRQSSTPSAPGTRTCSRRSCSTAPAAWSG